MLEYCLGEVICDNVKYMASIFQDKCIIKHKDFELIKILNNKWVEFRYTTNYHDVKLKHSNSYMLFLENPNYIGHNEIIFDITYFFYDVKKEIKSISFNSKTLTNFYNGKFTVDELNRSNVLSKLNSNLQKENEYNVQLPTGHFIFIFQNNIISSINKKTINNLFPFEFQTTLTIKRVNSNLSIDDILFLIKYFFYFNRFISLNKYTKIDKCFINYECSIEECNSEIEILKDYANTYSFEECFNIEDFGNSIISFFEKNGAFLKHSDNIYPFENDKIYAFDIVRVSGAFEKIFEKYVSKTVEYKQEIDNLKKEVYYDDFSKMVDSFKKEYQLSNNEIFGVMCQNFTRFGTLKMKLEYILKKYCFYLKYDYQNIDGLAIFYDPINMSDRFKNARNDIGHGLEKNTTNWYGAAKDVFFVQQLIYFIILKYALNVSDEKIKNALERVYRYYSYGFIDLNE